MHRTLLLACLALQATASPDVLKRKYCGAPSDPGCEVCCIKVGNNLELRKWAGEGGALKNVEPWYNAVEVVRGKTVCPSETPICQRCSARELKQYQQLLANGPPKNCECKGRERLDPCFNPDSCRCYCEIKVRLVDCEAKPQRG